MKKIISFVLAALMLCSICVLASAEDADCSGFKISAPSGAPALALATLAVQNPDQYTFIAAETISAEFANATADFLIAPINAGAKLYKAGKSTYKLGAVVSWGNLYFASQKENFTLDDLNGGAVTLFGENTINASIALFALEENGIVPATVDYLASAANTQSLLLSDENAIVLTAEPALTAAKMKNDSITAYALNDLYEAATGYQGFAQAGLFIKAETIAEKPEATEAYLKLVEESIAKCESDPDAVAEAAAALEILPNAKVAKTALPNCAVRFVGALDAKEQVERTAEVDLSQYGGAVPADDFYYGAA